MKNKILLTSILLLFTFIPKTNAMREKDTIPAAELNTKTTRDRKVNNYNIKYAYDRIPDRQKLVKREVGKYNIIIPREKYANKRVEKKLPYDQNKEDRYRISNPFSNRPKKIEKKKEYNILNPFIKSKKKQRELKERMEKENLYNNANYVNISEAKEQMDEIAQEMEMVIKKNESEFYNKSMYSIEEKEKNIKTIEENKDLIKNYINSIETNDKNTNYLKSKITKAEDMILLLKMKLYNTIMNQFQAYIISTYSPSNKNYEYYNNIKTWLDSFMPGVAKIINTYEKYNEPSKIIVPPQKNNNEAKNKIEYCNLMNNYNDVNKIIEDLDLE